MVLAVISDTHLPRGRRRLPPACLERLAAADAILHAGDFIEEPVLDHLKSLGPPVHAVHGNVDTPALRVKLSETLEADFDGVRIAMVHDAGPRAGRVTRLRARFPDAAAVVFGHSHLPLIEHGGGFTIFNPGSPTDRRRAPAHTMGIATVTAAHVAFELVALD